MRAALLLTLAVGCGHAAAPAPQASEDTGTAPAEDTGGPAAPEPHPVALVELFTSEGCSSCPPAEALLSKLYVEGKPDVILLAFHVDYWDSAGWKDRFSNAAFSARQRAYAKVWGKTSVYTPQMVVGGAFGFTGSDEATARKKIDAALGEGRTVGLRIDSFKRNDDGTTTVEYSIAGADGANVVGVIAERGLQTKPTGGELAGVTVKETNVVRGFVTTPVSGTKGTLSIPTPTAVVDANAAVVLYVQDPTTLVISAGTTAALAP